MLLLPTVLLPAFVIAVRDFPGNLRFRLSDVFKSACHEKIIVG